MSYLQGKANENAQFAKIIMNLILELNLKTKISSFYTIGQSCVEKICTDSTAGYFNETVNKQLHNLGILPKYLDAIKRS